MERGRGTLASSGPVPALAAVVFLAHVAVSAWGPYELHRDALLYVAMGEHLRLLHMDFPPFIAILANLERVLGDSPVMLHLGPALAHAILVVLAGAFAGRAGGGAGSRVVAAAVVATAPLLLRAGSLFQPVVFDQLWWTLALWFLLRAGEDDGVGPQGTPWVWLGIVLGLGLLTKLTILVLGAAMLVGVLASPMRRWLATPWPWVAAAVALVVGSPAIVGQVRLGWPFFTQLQGLQATQLNRVTPISFTADQLLMIGPGVLVAVGGAAWAAARSRASGFRALGWTTVAAYALLLLAGGKAYYLGPIWPALLGIGFARLGRWAARAAQRRPSAGRATWRLAAGTAIAFGLVALPLGLPFLPPAPMARYAAGLGVAGAVTTNTGQRLRLPQDYADMLGWTALADSVVAVWESLSSRERARAVILATNYGRAGAIDFYGGGRVPPVVAPVGSYWFWGPGELPGDVTIVVGGEPSELRGSYFREAELAKRVLRPWGVPEERDVPITLARGPIRPLQEIWPEFRGVN